MTKNLSNAAEDCLLLVHRVMERQEIVTTSKLARRLGVTDSTVTSMIQKLTKLNLLNHRPRKEITLTAEGAELALKMIRRHRLIETYLHDKLDYAWDEVHAEAEQLEHSVSDRFVEAISAVLNHPTLDPHGDPIPDRNGLGDARKLHRLSETAVGTRGRIARVLQDTPDALVYLADNGLKPGVAIEIVEAPDYDSVIVLKVDNKNLSLGEKLASQIMIENIQ